MTSYSLGSRDTILSKMTPCGKGIINKMYHGSMTGKSIRQCSQ